MPLRPLHRATGEPKADHELTADEQATRATELEEDRRMMVARGHRSAIDTAALESYQRSQEQSGKR